MDLTDLSSWCASVDARLGALEKEAVDDLGKA